MIPGVSGEGCVCVCVYLLLLTQHSLTLSSYCSVTEAERPSCISQITSHLPIISGTFLSPMSVLCSTPQYLTH